jgi:hypothetical protein
MLAIPINELAGIFLHFIFLHVFNVAVAIRATNDMLKVTTN